MIIVHIRLLDRSKDSSKDGYALFLEMRGWLINNVGPAGSNWRWYAGMVSTVEFNNEDDAIMFKLRFEL